MNSGVFAITGRVVYVPVRHHSPACAALVRRLVRELRPRAILIEGPSDFNGRLDELLLPHTLPIAIYSYVALSDGTRRGAFYPFCLYSPEWQALMAARDSGAAARPDRRRHRHAGQGRAGRRPASSHAGRAP